MDILCLGLQGPKISITPKLNLHVTKRKLVAPCIDVKGGRKVVENL